MSIPKIIMWLLAAAVTVAVICEGTYRLLGNGVVARIICTVALIAVAPLFVKPFIYKEPGSRPDPMTEKPEPKEKESDSSEEI